MIPHPHYLQDPRYFFSDLELLLRRYDVELHAAAIQTPAGPVAVMGFAGPRWVNACNSSTFNHKAARKFYEAYANPVVVAEREKTQRGKL